MATSNPLDWRTATDEELLGLDPIEILRMRYANPFNRMAQNRLAPIDHQIFTREAAREGGPLTALALGLAAPAYYVKKKVFAGDEFTSDPSMEQIRREYIGLGQGLKDWHQSKVKTRVRKKENPLIIESPEDL